ncbi:MAG: photosynthetic complex assembly protein PuhC [Pseudomonadota bacterium]
MATTHYHPPIRRRAPAVFRYGPFIFLGCMLVLAAVSSWTGIGKMDVSPEPAVDSMAIRFVDEADGGIGVYDPVTNEQIHVYPAETGGFVRTALRALALDRRRRGIGPEPVFHLNRSESGRVILFDPSTDKFVTLEAFGSENTQAFTQLFAKTSGGIS